MNYFRLAFSLIVIIPYIVETVTALLMVRAAGKPVLKCMSGVYD